MTDGEVKVSIRQLVGTYPYPELEPEQAVVLGAGLVGYTRNEFNQALSQLIRLGEHWRPTPAEVLNRVSSVHWRLASQFPALPPASACNPLPWLQQCRQALAEAAKARSAAA
jgi:hypothetical protein